VFNKIILDSSSLFSTGKGNKHNNI